jgi:hypothetical protein
VLLKGKLHEPCAYTFQHNQSIHLTAGMAVMSLSASLLEDKCGQGLSMPNHVEPNIIM